MLHNVSVISRHSSAAVAKLVCVEIARTATTTEREREREREREKERERGGHTCTLLILVKLVLKGLPTLGLVDFVLLAHGS